MSDFPVAGPALKKLVKKSRKQPINFGYNPGTDDNDQFLAAHKRKQPEMLGKIARNDGAGTKAAFGTFAVSGSIMTLTCLRELPQLAKRIKKLLRMNKINLNVQVLDKDGNVIDSDIEEMEDGTWFNEADDDADEDDEDDADEAGGEAAAAEVADGRFVARDAEPPTEGDPRLAKLRDAIARIVEQVETLPEAAAAPLLKEIDAVAAKADAGEAEAAVAELRAVQEALKAAQTAQAKWDTALAALEPKVTAALSGRTVADPSDLRIKWQYAVGLAGDGAFERAVAALTPVVAILKSAGGVAVGNGEQESKGVVAFQSSRILWLGARSQMLDEARALAAAITAQGADEEDAAEIAAAGQEIIAEVEQIDARLQSVLDDLTVSPEGREREALKRRAAGIVAEYQSMLGTGIFAMIDQNPFAKVAVAARARAALSTIARSLS